MRPIYSARLDKTRPVLILTRELVRPYLRNVTVAPVTSTIRGLSSEVLLGQANGLDHECVASCDNITTVPAHALRRRVGFLLPTQEEELARAISLAFDLP